MCIQIPIITTYLSIWEKDHVEAPVYVNCLQTTSASLGPNEPYLHTFPHEEL